MPIFSVSAKGIPLEGILLFLKFRESEQKSCDEIDKGVHDVLRALWTVYFWHIIIVLLILVFLNAFLDVMLGRLRASNLFDEKSLEAIHIFNVEELGNYLSQAGFKGFAHNIYGPYIPFHAEKG